MNIDINTLWIFFIYVVPPVVQEVSKPIFLLTILEHYPQAYNSRAGHDPLKTRS